VSYLEPREPVVTQRVANCNAPPQLKKSAGRALERGWIAEMLAGTRLGVAGANIGNLAASHLPFASHPQPCASYWHFYRQPSPSHRG